MLTFGRCFAEEQCPYFEALGAYLGKPKREFDALDPFCPDWQEWWEESLEGEIKPGTPPENIAYIKGVPERMLRKGLGSSCEEWRRSTRTLLHDQNVPRDLPKLDVQLRLRDGGQGVVPEAAVRVGGHNVWALLDAGATQFFLQGEPGNDTTWGISRLRPATVWTARGFVPAPDINLARLHLSTAVVSDLTASIVIGRPLQSDMGIGMNLFMHYGTVCFDWRNEMLHLGRLGSCAEGLESKNAIISPGFIPYVEATANRPGDDTDTSGLPETDSTPPRAGRPSLRRRGCSWTPAHRRTTALTPSPSRWRRTVASRSATA